MAEAIKLNLTVPSNQKNTDLENPLIINKKKTEHKKEKNKEYQIENYYKSDTLGSDVLKQKYLAPWEQHPYQLWERQAKALASVEKTEKLKKKWENKFYQIL